MYYIGMFTKTFTYTFKKRNMIGDCLDLMVLIVEFYPTNFIHVDKKFNAISKKLIKLVQDRSYTISWLENNYYMSDGCIHFDSGLMSLDAKNVAVKCISICSKLFLHHHKDSFAPIVVCQQNKSINHLLIYHASISMHGGSWLEFSSYRNNRDGFAELLQDIETNVRDHVFKLVRQDIDDFCNVVDDSDNDSDNE